MKGVFCGLVLLLAGMAYAQTTNNAAAPAAPSLEAELPGATQPPAPTALRELKPNELALGPLTLDGIAVETAKADNPLQLLNPAAPAEYGPAEDNVVRDPINGRVTGLKVFGIRF